MRLSIIIVNYRAWGYLETALDALLVDFPTDEWEVIVVDNESQAKPLQVFESRYPWVHFISNPLNSGFAYANNLGATHATGTLLLFMNPDVVADSNAILRLIDEKDSLLDVGILAPKQTNTRGRPQKVFDDFPTFFNQSKILKGLFRILNPGKTIDPRDDHQCLTYCDWVSGSVLLISRSDYDVLGGWSADYWMYVEDTDLCWRAHAKGRRVAYLPTVVVVHAHGGSSRRNPEIAAMTKLEVIISKHVFVSKHFPQPKRWFTHVFIALLKLPPLGLAAVLDLLTFHRIPVLYVRGKILNGLLRYYSRVVRTGNWRSPRSLANDEVSPQTSMK